MKKLLLLAAFSCSTLILAAQQQVNVDKKVSVTFPGTAQSQNSEYGNMWYGAVAGNDPAKAMAMTMSIPLSSMDQDSAAIAAHYDDPAFTEGLVTGMLGKLPGVKLLSQKKVTKQGRKGYIMELEKGTPDEQFPYKKLYTMLIFAGESIYMQAVYAVEGVDVTAVKNTFFDSFRVN